jgi:folate-binding protein YgfZ
MLSYFRVFVLPDSVLIEDVGEIGDTTFQALRKFLLYGTKAKMENLGPSWSVLLVSGPQAPAVIRAAFGCDVAPLKPLQLLIHDVGGQPALFIRSEETGEMDIEVLVPDETVGAVWERLWAAGQPMGLAAFGTEAREALRLEAGLPKSGAELTEAIVPPEANLEGKAFSLNKGCYPGQEVVARSQFRGTLKRRGYLVHSAGLLQPGQELFHESDAEQPAGIVAQAAPAPGGGSDAIVSLQVAAAQGGRLAAGSADGPHLELLPLPYLLLSDV